MNTLLETIEEHLTHGGYYDNDEIYGLQQTDSYFEKSESEELSRLQDEEWNKV